MCWEKFSKGYKCLFPIFTMYLSLLQVYIWIMLFPENTCTQGIMFVAFGLQIQKKRPPAPWDIIADGGLSG